MQFLQKKKGFFLFALITIFISSCSLKYDDDAVAAGKQNPELIFKNTKFSRFEDNLCTAEVSAELIEKYKNKNAVYASGVEFSTFKEPGEDGESVSNTGSCGLLFADSNSEIYELFNGIKLYSNDFGAHFYANSLKWNGVNQQLIGDRRDTVRVEKDDMIIFGTGFSASAISGTYKFSGTVTGEMTTE
ncbi:MAG: hypothetical protein MJ160_04855 [Treponema sp.]|nr:hypothetical protein [Treponema sp.]